MTTPILNLGERLTLVKESGQRDAADRLHTVAVRLLRTASAVDAEMDLDGPRASLLSVLVFGGPMPVSRLAEVERVTPPAITKQVDALSELGLVRRLRSETDRRVVLVEATPAGRQVLERGRAARVRRIAELLGDATEEEWAVIGRAAEIIAARLPRRPG
ncbi:MarR family winged helix-turn-helix transcriptional regulator [Dactylosporangium sucinum]|uniref:MarR family winged helix-turn-helix transcriptional regulator n=1 Tax=Dactylosporangium sucinum TaxID=1424081 RepID=UPI00167CD034|nr:MarR family transcriptional regulator [Dactylosporangium sucinum]